MMRITIDKHSGFCFGVVYAIEMAESYIRDKKRVIPCASLCEGEFDINGYFIGVPTVIGSGGVEKILDFNLTKNGNCLQNCLV